MGNTFSDDGSNFLSLRRESSDVISDEMLLLDFTQRPRSVPWGKLIPWYLLIQYSQS